MSSPFPGMDPYLENPELWSEFHNRLIVAIADTLLPHLRPKYQVAIEKRTYLSGTDDSVLVGIPDATVFRGRSVAHHPSTKQPLSTVTLPAYREPIRVTVPVPEEARESYLEIREGGTSDAIAVLEVLSPKNKRVGVGRQAYERKRQQVLASITHLVEIDLLRGGKPMPILGDEQATDYRLLISRGDCRPVSYLYAFSLQEQIPPFPLPLKAGDVEPVVDLQQIVDGVYDRAGYDLRINYTQPTVPPLSESDAAWADKLLREKGLKTE